MNSVTPCPPKSTFFQFTTRPRLSPTLLIFIVTWYIHTLPISLFKSFVDPVLKIEPHCLVTLLIPAISNYFTTGSWRHDPHSSIPSTLPLIFSRTIQYLTYKKKFYASTKVIRGLSRIFPYSVVPYRIGNIPSTVYSLQQLRLPPRRFQVSMENFSKVHSIHKTTAFIRYRPRRLKHNSSSSTPRLVNYHRLIKFSTVSAYNSMFWKVFEEAVKGIRVVSLSFEKYLSDIGFFFWTFLRLFLFSFSVFALFVIFSWLFIFFFVPVFHC